MHTILKKFPSEQINLRHMHFCIILLILSFSKIPIHLLFYNMKIGEQLYSFFVFGAKTVSKFEEKIN
jgi:hypothetical protein